LRESIRRLLPKNRFVRGVSILAGGTATGQVIVVLAAPLLTRLYGPEDFGLLAVFTAMLMSMGLIASLRYQLAIPLTEKDQEAVHVVVLCLLVVAGITLFSCVLVFFFRQQIAQLLNVPLLTGYLWLLPVGLLLLGTYQVFNFWAIRVKAFPIIAKTKFIQAASMVAVQTGGYVLGPLALLLGMISQQGAGVTTLGALTIRKKWPLFKSTRWEDILQAAKRYRRFPIYSTWGGGFNRVGAELAPVLFSAFFSPATAGFYALAHRVIAMPMKLIGRAIADVFFSSSPEALRTGRLGMLVANVHTKLAQIAMPPALFLFIVGPDLFRLVFGEKWAIAGQVARWLSPMLYTQFIVSPLSRVLMVLEQQAVETMLQFVLLASRFVAIIIGVWIDDFMIAVIIYGISSSLVYILYYSIISILCGNSLTTVWYSSLKTLPISLLLMSPLLITVCYNYDQVWLFVMGMMSILFTAIFYCMLIYKTVDKTRQQV
jgi:O-antigen/teichoic acid export membrane protein